MPTHKRILTIDSGGLRGVFSAAIIERMEAVTGKPAREYFDCFYGTSIGAIPAGELDEQNKIEMAAYMVEELMDDINLLQNQIMKRLEEDQKLCWYKRYTIKYEKASFDHFDIPTAGIDFDKIAEMDAAKYVPKLAEIGSAVAQVLFKSEDF